METIIVISILIVGAALLYAYLPDEKGKKFKEFIKMIFSFFPLSAIIRALKVWRTGRL